MRAVLFDADGVVQRTAPAWRESLVALCADPEQAEDFVTAVFAAESPCLAGSGDFREALTDVLRRFDSARTVEEALRIWTLIEPAEEVLAQVRALRDQGILTALATNQQAYRAAYMTEQLGYARSFDRLFYSCELGHAKPAPGYFGAVLEQLGVAPGETLFLDDQARNVEAARGAGLRAEVFHADQGAETLRQLLCSHGLPAA